MAKALKIVGTVVAVVGLAIVTAGAAIPGLAAALGSVASMGSTLLAVGLGLGAASSLLAPKPKAPSMPEAAVSRLTVSIDPRTPRKIVFGITAGSTDLR